MFYLWKGFLHAVLSLTKPVYHLLISSTIIYRLLSSIISKYRLLVTMVFVAHSYREQSPLHLFICVSEFAYCIPLVFLFSLETLRRCNPLLLLPLGAGDEKSKRVSELTTVAVVRTGRNPEEEMRTTIYQVINH